jgi:L-ribulose-5-phosphate 3-epimerase
MTTITRRHFLSAAGGVAAATLLGPHLALGMQPATAPSVQQRYKIGGCDWIMLKRQKIGSFKLAKECGMDGVEVDMGSLGDRPDMKNQLRDPAFRQQYLDACSQYHVEICSLAMSAFYGQSWADHPKCDSFTDEWIDLLQGMNVKTGFLPMGVKGDIAHDPAERSKVVDHLKRAAPGAEKAGVVLGIEAALDTDGYKRFLDDIGSPNVRLYYNFGDQMAAGQDIYQQLRDLGKDRICQIHCTEKDGAWLGQGKLDMPKAKKVLDEMGWSGWLVIERSRVKGKSVKENFTANASYLKTLFQTA